MRSVGAQPTRHAAPIARSLDVLLLAPTAVFLCLVWSLHYPGNPVVQRLGAGFNAAADLLFVMAGWRTAPSARPRDPIGPRRLLRAGALRFLPLHLVVLAISIACSLEFRHQGFSRTATIPATDALSLAANLFLVHGWFPAETFLGLWNPHLWILGAGLLWLQCAPGIVHILDRALDRLSPWLLAGALWSAGLACLLALRAFLPPSILDTSSTLWTLMLPLPRLWEFALGALCRLAWDRPRRAGGLRRLLDRPGASAGAAAGCCAAAALLVGSSIDPLGGPGGALLSQPLLTAPLWGILLLALREPERPRPPLLFAAGRAALAVLLLAPWSFWIAIALHGCGLRLPLPAFYPLVAAGTGALAHVLQLPLRALLDRWWPPS